jgi:ketosteroid isomerase-like protein
MTEHTPRNEAEAVVLRLAAAMSARDLDAVDACLADDFVRYGEETSWEPMPKTAFRAMGENFTVPFPDYAWEITEMVSDGNRVAVQLIETGTFIHPWDLRGRIIQPTNTKYVLHGAIFFTMNEDNLIQAYTYIHDSGFVAAYGDVLDEPSVTTAIPHEARSS